MAKKLAAGQCTAETRLRIARLKASLEEQLTCLRQLDEEILRDLVNVEGVTDEDIAEEAQVAGNLKRNVNTTIAALAELLRQKPPSPQQEHPQSAGEVKVCSHDSKCACEASKTRGEGI